MEEKVVLVACECKKNGTCNSLLLAQVMKHMQELTEKCAQCIWCSSSKHRTTVNYPVTCSSPPAPTARPSAIPCSPGRDNAVVVLVILLFIVIVILLLLILVIVVFMKRRNSHKEER